MVNVNVGEESASRGLHKDRQEAEQGDGDMDSCSDESGMGIFTHTFKLNYDWQN
jgi:hypothetical protein